MPDLPKIENLVPTVRGDNAIIDFSAVKGAADYRIYPLPAQSDILVGAGGEVSVKNAVYRCAGALPRQDRSDNGINGYELSLSGSVEGYTRQESESVLGYVYLTPGTGRVPVYRVADPNSVGGYMWEDVVPPAKEFNGADYVKDTQARDALLAKGWRDDGIAFYVPSDGTRPVYRSAASSGSKAVLFYTDGPEKTVRDSQGGADTGERFKVLASPADGAVPLYRIYYSYNNDHDNLAAGDANRDRVLHQGNVPITSLMWSGLKQTTTFVVEALDQGCPFPGGYIGATAVPASVLGGVANEPTITLDGARLPSGEVFINGQFDPGNRPKPIARAYVTVDPKPHPTMDWFESFDQLSPFQTVVSDGNGTRVFRNDKLSVEFQATDGNYSYGVVQNQFFAGSTASFAVVALGANAHIEADKFVHATMSADLASTKRRYPQIWITDTPLGDPNQVPSYQVPFQPRLGPVPPDTSVGQYHTIVTQTFGGSPELEVQFCDQRGWGVSEQCPRANIYGFPAGDYTHPFTQPWLPLPLPAELAGMDRLVKFDVYASTSRVYFFIEDRPAGCAVLPAGRMPAGPVNVIFGEAAYHIEIDEFVTPENSSQQYWRRYSTAHVDRKMDDLGVESGVSLPGWDESVMPCGSRYYGQAI